MKRLFLTVFLLIAHAVGLRVAAQVDLGPVPADLTCEAPVDSICEVPADSICKVPADSTALSGNWFQQLWHADFNINDPRIRYPRFMNFCRNVYNWADETFNRYDTAYVVGTGKNWKLLIDSTNEMQRYGYLFDIQSPSNAELVSVRSNLAYDIGLRLSFMAVSVGYTWNINDKAKFNNFKRSTFDFQFTCSRFSAEAMYQNIKGGTYIDRFAGYNGGRRVNIPLDNTSNETFNLSAYYFFNHRKYAQAAAYCFSKYQKRSAGSWLIGARYIRRRLILDFSNLSAGVLAFKPEGLGLINTYNFHDICLQGGYAYNFVFPHNWVLNLTVLPGIGYRRSLIEDKPAPSEMVALNLDGRLSLVYNHRALFANFQARINGNFLFDRNYSFLMASEFFALKTGVRF